MRTSVSALAVWLGVWIAVAVIVIITLAACAMLLFRQASTLFRTLQRFQQEVQPLAEEVASGAARASEAGERIQRRRP